MPARGFRYDFHKRFWNMVVRGKPFDCWLWRGGISKNTGYGNFNVNGVTRSAHRVAFEIANGPIPDGARVLHSCDVRRCVNPAHLRAGSALDNTTDMWQRGRARPSRAKRFSGERHPNAKLSDAQVAKIRDLLRAPERNGSAIARQYGVSKTTISAIKNGRTRV